MINTKIVKISPNPENWDTTSNECDQNTVNTLGHNQRRQPYYENKHLGLYLGIQDSHHKNNTAQLSNGHEFVTILTGSVNIKNNKTGNIDTVKKGQSFVLPSGYDYHWQQHDYLRKLHLIYQPPAPTDCRTNPHKQLMLIDEESDTPWQSTSDGSHKIVIFQSPDEKFTAGLWRAKHIKTKEISFPYNEFMLIKYGCLLCTQAQGHVIKVNAGEALFVPQGARCAWEAQGKISLCFVQIKAF